MQLNTNVQVCTLVYAYAQTDVGVCMYLCACSRVSQYYLIYFTHVNIIMVELEVVVRSVAHRGQHQAGGRHVEPMQEAMSVRRVGRQVGAASK